MEFLIFLFDTGQRMSYLVPNTVYIREHFIKRTLVLLQR